MTILKGSFEEICREKTHLIFVLRAQKKYIPIKLCPGTFEYQTATTLSERYLFKGAILIKKIKITTIETTFTQNRNQLGKIQYIEHAR